MSGKITVDIPAGSDSAQEVVLQVKDTQNHTVDAIERKGAVTVEVF